MTLLLWLIVGFSRAICAPICPPSVSLISGHQSLIKKVAVYDGITPESGAEYASKKGMTSTEIKKRYEASNVFGCENAWGNGQVIGNRRTITTVLHTLYVDGDCNKPRPLKKCTYIYQGGKKDQLFAVDKILASGGCKPGSKLQDKNDWVILSLVGEVPGEVKPYELPVKGSAISPGDQTVIVGKTTGLKPVDMTNGNISQYPKSHADCVAMGRSSFKFEGLVQSNCPSDKGCSGCALLTPGDSPKLMAINSGTITTKNNCVPEDGNGDSGAFQLNCRGSLMIPVEGAFFTALEKLQLK